MKKLTLRLDELSVETFEAAAAEAAPRGTVHGHLENTDIRVCPTGSGCYTDDDQACFNTRWSACTDYYCHSQPCIALP